MIAKTKSYVFPELFLAVFALGPRFWTAQLMFCMHGFQNNNRAAQSDGFIGEYCGNSSCEDDTEMTPPFRLDTNTL